jgi:hypothetical protein
LTILHILKNSKIKARKLLVIFLIYNYSPLTYFNYHKYKIASNDLRVIYIKLIKKFKIKIEKKVTKTIFIFKSDSYLDTNLY